MLMSALLVLPLAVPQGDDLADRLRQAWAVRRPGPRALAPSVVEAQEDGVCPYCRAPFERLSFDVRPDRPGSHSVVVLVCRTDGLGFARTVDDCFSPRPVGVHPDADEPFHIGPFRLPADAAEAAAGLEPFGLVRVEPRLTGEAGWCTVHRSPDRRFVIGGGHDGVTRLWSKQEIDRLEHPFGPTARAFAPRSDALAQARSGGELFLWTLPEGRREMIPRTSFRNIESLAFDPSASRLALAWREREAVCIEILRLADRKVVATLDGADVGDGVSPFEWSADGRRIARADRRGRLVVWDVDTGRAVGRHDAEVAIRDLSWSADGRFVALALGQRGWRAQVVDLEDGSARDLSVRDAPDVAHPDGAPAVAIDAAGARLLWLLPDGTIAVGDLAAAAGWRLHFGTDRHRGVGWDFGADGEGGFWTEGLQGARFHWDPSTLLVTGRIRVE